MPMTTFVVLACVIAALVAAAIAIPLLGKRTDGAPRAAYSMIAVLAGLLLGAASLYAAWSNFDWAQPAPAADSPQRMVASLARKLEREPNNLEGWLMLGRSHLVLEQFPLAARAFQRADRLATGRNAEALTGLAESLAMQDEAELDGRAGRLFEQALQLDPDSGKALFFAAAVAMRRGDNVVARERFARLLALNPPDNVKPILEQQIAKLDALAAQPTAAAGSAVVQVAVSLDQGLRQTWSADTPLFVIVRDPTQPGPPLAVKRLATTFPTRVELTAQDAMIATRTFAVGQTVEVVARIAKGGTPTAASGDPFGQVRYHVGKDGPLELVINQVTP
jgi:cytochrome c-type biogenesis protein CcmH